MTQVAGFDKAAVPPVLLVFGGGLVAGNLLGGKLADRRLEATVLGSLLALAAVLAGMSIALHSHALAIVFVGLLGVAAFATVAPLQMWVLSKADGAGATLASSFNIAAFNLGNALGAWVGGVVIASGPGLPAVTWAAMVLPLLGAAVAWFTMRGDSPAPSATASRACASPPHRRSPSRPGSPPGRPARSRPGAPTSHSPPMCRPCWTTRRCARWRASAWAGAACGRCCPTSTATSRWRSAQYGSRAQVNAWIRGSGEFDAVADFDALLRDPANPARLLPAFDSGDHLHPGDRDNAAMARALTDATPLGAAAESDQNR